ncbi:hypothetical protein ABZ557_03425 [Streptomyces sp. NPDC019645]|uniref:hypothetical protein n=1 Tax=Streptomyces sp. NPDC019645 TaxID=3154786 RepID=UPI0033FDDBF3
MTDWSRLCDAYGSAERTPELLDCLGAGAGEEVWRELWGRLCHQGTVSSASFAAIPRLAEVARHGQSDDSSRALVLAGAIMRGALQNHGADDVILLCSAAVEDLRRLADERLVDRPDGYLGLFSVLLALEGHALWSEVIDDFTDDFYELAARTALRVSPWPSGTMVTTPLAVIGTEGTCTACRSGPSARTNCAAWADACM